ncbi:bifunctional response regulator/alkaline phosphatase family protein [Flammeovirga sp. MY04]|uniref:T9SS response regulator signal transducer PorX n=1 Tax=Flammeovirga sp. MY04 TaxID=1191459 RepID=UPI000806381C|nr:bifunctional response regulator/alkaline phosphatase family protein [Flammeovirga sp. MY04]ANQ47546.1 bifunctional response regulator/alkaline phosphatase family protein [Flammeovirga sp. MY04]
MSQQRILWADDEIDLLKPHILFLTKKGYEVTPVLSGLDAIEKCEEEEFDIIFLDENMPGMTGLEALEQIKRIRPSIPVVMITKSEEEYIMEDAIGAKIADYLIKPINPKQILLSVKKLLDKKKLVDEKTNSAYQQDFQSIMMSFMNDMDWEDWVETYKKIVYWDLEINQTENKSMSEVFEMQKNEANHNFCRFIKDNYEDWMDEPDERPVLSHELLAEKVFPYVKENDKPVFFILIDNLRYDQWKVIEPLISELYSVKEDVYCPILPTTTAYARNAIFSGLMPSEIEATYPEWWVNDNDEESKNNYEEELLGEQLLRHRIDGKYSYHKIIRTSQGKQVNDQINSLMHRKFNAIVYNFVDMLSHARTDTNMVRELAPDEAAYRSITKSWFEHSSLYEMLKILAEKDCKVYITTDHGTVRTRKPYKIVGDRETNTNLRYKQGKNLSYNKKNVLAVKHPEDFGLPKTEVSTSFVFAMEDYFFAYPNNYNYYVSYYKDTFQHGGISIDEMIIPFIELGQK